MKARTLQNALNEMAFDPLFRALAVATPWEQMSELAAYVAIKDPYGEMNFVRRALSLIDNRSEANAASFLEHQLWCAWREARWQAGIMDETPTPLHVVNPEWLRESRDTPTIIVAPMTVTLSDAILSIRSLLNNRPFTIYGEGMDSISSGNTIPGNRIAGSGLGAVRHIQRTLERNGVLCTYPDFVYRGHATCQTTLFSVSRPISSGFLSLAAQTGIMLLPCVLLRDGDAIIAHLEEPTRIELDGYGAKARHAAIPEIAQLVANSLETLIRRAPHQWLLLPTLTFDSPQLPA